MILAAGGGSDSAPVWVVWLTASIAAVAAIVAAVVAAVVSARSGESVKRLEIEADKLRSAEATREQRIRDLENRNAERKYETYKPIMELLRSLIDAGGLAPGAASQTAFRAELSKFGQWVTIFGSDEAVIAFQRFMQCVYSSPPSFVLMRYYAEFVLAARRDMGYPDTEVQPYHFLGMRVNDVYQSPFIDAMKAPLPEVHRAHNWTPPWATVEPDGPPSP